MEENSKSPEEREKELTPEELNKVAGGAGLPGGGLPTTQHEGWIEINSFQWGGE